jgi:hypothetical protein
VLVYFRVVSLVVSFPLDLLRLSHVRLRGMTLKDRDVLLSYVVVLYCHILLQFQSSKRRGEIYISHVSI